MVRAATVLSAAFAARGALAIAVLGMEGVDIHARQIASTSQDNGNDHPVAPVPEQVISSQPASEHNPLEQSHPEGGPSVQTEKKEELIIEHKFGPAPVHEAQEHEAVHPAPEQVAPTPVIDKTKEKDHEAVHPAPEQVAPTPVVNKIKEKDHEAVHPAPEQVAPTPVVDKTKDKDHEAVHPAPEQVAPTPVINKTKDKDHEAVHPAPEQVAPTPIIDKTKEKDHEAVHPAPEQVAPTPVIDKTKDKDHEAVHPAEQVAPTPVIDKTKEKDHEAPAPKEDKKLNRGKTKYNDTKTSNTWSGPNRYKGAPLDPDKVWHQTPVRNGTDPDRKEPAPASGVTEKNEKEKGAKLPDGKKPALASGVTKEDKKEWNDRKENWDYDNKRPKNPKYREKKQEKRTSTAL